MSLMSEHFNLAIWVSPVPVMRCQFIEAIIDAAKPMIGMPDKVACLNYERMSAEPEECWDGSALLEIELHEHEILAVYFASKAGKPGERSGLHINESAATGVYNLSLIPSDFESENFFEGLKALAIRLYQTAGKFTDSCLVGAGYEFEINSVGGDLRSTLQDISSEPGFIEIIVCPPKEGVDLPTVRFERTITPGYQLISNQNKGTRS